MMVAKKKIIFLLHVPPPVHGSSVVGLAVKESVKIKEEFDCFYINLLASKNISQTGRINFEKIIGFIANWFRLMKVLITNRPDICYLAMTTTGVAFFRDVLMIVWIRLFGLKRVYHLHNKGIITKRNNYLYRYAYKFIFKDAKVILLAKSLYADIEQYVDKNDVYVCPNGVADSFEMDASNTMADQPKNTPVHILYLSNLIKSKGVIDLVEACSILHKKGLNFECTFVGGEGDVKESDFAAKVIEFGLADKVKYVGKKFGKEKAVAFTNADIFAFPTYYPNECFPLVLLEAMSYSLPIVSTFEGGIADIIDDGVTGLLVQQRDVSALAEKLEDLMENPDKRAMLGREGRRKYEQEFKLEIFENRMLEILKLTASQKA